MALDASDNVDAPLSGWMLTLVGAGKMGMALARGWLASGLTPEQLTIVEPSPSQDLLSLADQFGVRVNPTKARPADVLVLAVKPQTLAAAAASLASYVLPEGMILSVLAGKTIDNLRQAFPHCRTIVRAMPNTPAAIGRGVTGVFASQDASKRQRMAANALLSGVGTVVWLDTEEWMDAVTAVSGSGPAYVFAFVEALALAGESLGLPKHLAMQLARGTVEGAGALLSESPKVSATQLMQNVTSPGGTTEAALKILKSDQGVGELLRHTVTAAHARSRELAG